MNSVANTAMSVRDPNAQFSPGDAPMRDITLMLREAGIAAGAGGIRCADKSAELESITTFLALYRQHGAEALHIAVTRGEDRQAFSGALALIQKGLLNDIPDNPLQPQESWLHVLARQGCEPGTPDRNTLSLTARFKALIAAGYSLEAPRWGASSLIECAVGTDNLASFQAQLSAGARITDGSRLMDIAQGSGARAMIRELAALGFAPPEKPDTSGYENPLIDALLAHDMRGVVRLLKQPETNINKEDALHLPPLLAAATTGRADSLRHLVRHPDIHINAATASGMTALHIAASEGFDNCIRVLLSHPEIDVNAKMKNGATPLHLASQRGSGIGLCLLLQDKRTDLNARTQDGLTPLHIATRDGQLTALRALSVRRRTDPNAACAEGHTALHIAAWAGNAEAAGILLESATTKPNLSNKAGDTALHLAAKQGHLDVANALLKDRRTQRSLPDRQGKTASWLAMEAGHRPLAKMLSRSPLRAMISRCFSVLGQTT